MIGEILVKLASGMKLRSDEIKELEQWGNGNELHDSYIAGIQNGSSDITARNISALSVVNSALKTHCRLSNDSGYSITTGLGMWLDTDNFPSFAWSINENFGFTIDGGKIYFPFTGYYTFGIRASFASNSTGTDRAIFTYYSSTFTGNVSTHVPPVNGGSTSLNAFGEFFATKGEYVRLFAQQDSGGDLTLNNPGINVRLVDLA